MASSISELGEIVPFRANNVFQRFLHLGLVLWVSLATPIAGSFYYVLGGTAPSNPVQQNFRLVGALINEATSLLVLAYVLRTQGKTWRSIGWDPQWRDIGRSLGLLVSANIATWVVWIPIQYVFHLIAGRYFASKSLSSLFGFGISVLSVTLVCLNPFFEEFVVRAYTISQVMEFGGGRVVAIVVSVVAQMSYHLYQGAANALALTVLFTVLSIYFATTRRIVPVILVHLCLDLYVLLRGLF